MKISFPYMGQVTAYKKLLEKLGHEVIMPNKPTQRTFDLGVLYSPEFICYPFKVMTGTYIEACEAGAEVIVSSGGNGPCRAGMYGEVHKKILKQCGFKTELVIFDSLFQNRKYFFSLLKRIANGHSYLEVASLALSCMKIVSELDKIDKKINILRAYEVQKGSFDKVRRKIDKMYDEADTKKEIKAVYKKALKMLDEVPIKKADEKDRVRIGIVGEIFVIMESATNMEIEKRLNALGVEVTNVQCISEWVMHNLIPKKINFSKSWKVWHEGEMYKSCVCGGHDMENVGWINEFAKEKYDGVVHLMPFGCLPELITRSMIPEMSEKLDIPILSMSIDEQNGEANTQTRLEAFVDLCKNKKQKETKRQVM